MLFHLQLVLAIACVGMLVNGLLNFRRFDRDRALIQGRNLPRPAPKISVCVPARNEAPNIAACLESLARQDYPDFEVIMLDDCSEDETLAIAQRFAAGYPNIQVMQGEPLPPGWIGKPHACHQMGQRATGDWLLFTDADTVFSPKALSTALRLAEVREADLLSGLPGLRTVGIWERLSVPMLGVNGCGCLSMWAVSRPGLPWYAAASGAFLFFRREAYERLGGHEAVADHIVEDLQMARLVKKHRMRLVMTDITDLVWVRMYTSFHEVWEGFTKNFAKAFPGGMIFLAIAFLFTFFLVPFFSFICGPLMGWGFHESFTLPLIQIASMAWLRAMVDRRVGCPDLGAMLMSPLAAVFVSLIGLRSWSRMLLRQSTPWRNRSYDLWKE